MGHRRKEKMEEIKKKGKKKGGSVWGKEKGGQWHRKDSSGKGSTRTSGWTREKTTAFHEKKRKKKKERRMTKKGINAVKEGARASNCGSWGIKRGAGLGRTKKKNQRNKQKTPVGSQRFRRAAEEKGWGHLQGQRTKEFSEKRKNFEEKSIIHRKKKN